MYSEAKRVHAFKDTVYSDLRYVISFFLNVSVLFLPRMITI